MLYEKLCSGWVIWTFKFAMNESLGVYTKSNCSPMASEEIYVNSERTVKTCLILVLIKTMTYRSQNREAPHKILTFLNHWQNLTESQWIISVRLLFTGGESPLASKECSMCAYLHTLPLRMDKPIRYCVVCHILKSAWKPTAALFTAVMILTYIGVLTLYIFWDYSVTLYSQSIIHQFWWN